MKKYGKLLTKISLIVLAVSLFLSLSLSDVIRLNPQLEGVSKAQLVSTAKKATVALVGLAIAGALVDFEGKAPDVDELTKSRVLENIANTFKDIFIFKYLNNKFGYDNNI